MKELCHLDDTTVLESSAVHTRPSSDILVPYSSIVFGKVKLKSLSENKEFMYTFAYWLMSKMYLDKLIGYHLGNHTYLLCVLKLVLDFKRNLFKSLLM